MASSKEQAGVAVFAPAPELTVTLERLGERDEMHLHAGGQGFWIARLLSVLGVPTTLCASFGGETGAVVRALIEREGIDVVAVDVAGENGGYVHDRRSGERDEVGVQATMALTRHEIDDLYSAALVTGLTAGRVRAGRYEPRRSGGAGGRLPAPGDRPADQRHHRRGRPVRRARCTRR